MHFYSYKAEGKKKHNTKFKLWIYGKEIAVRKYQVH